MESRSIGRWTEAKIPKLRRSRERRVGAYGPIGNFWGPDRIYCHLGGSELTDRWCPNGGKISEISNEGERDFHS